MSTVTNVNVYMNPPEGCEQPTKGVASSGSSSIDFSFYAVYPDLSEYCVVLLKCPKTLSMTACQVNEERDGGIFTQADGGFYCALVTDTRDLNNWTVRASSDKDKAGAGTTFVAGTGGGGK